MGAHSLTLVDVEAWSRLMGVRFTPWEVETLAAIDAAVIKALGDKPAAKSEVR
jgi:hypothetical protein